MSATNKNLPKVNVVVQTAFLGDLLLSVPLLKNIKKLWPDKKLVLICRSGTGAMLHKIGLVDAVYEIVKGDRESYGKIQNSLKQFEIDKIFCPHQSIRSSLFISKLNAKEKIGFKEWWNFLFFNTRTVRPNLLPDALRQLSLLESYSESIRAEIKKADFNIFKTKDVNGKLSNVPDWSSSDVREHFLNAAPPKEFSFLKTSKPLVMLFPGSVWATKRWTTDGYIELAKKLEDGGKQVLWMGAGLEKPLCDELNKHLKSGIVLAGETSIYETCWLMARTSLVVGNDSSSSHMASLTNTPVVAIFGPTVIDFGYRPWSSKAYIAETDLFCRPCGPHGHQKCPLGTHDCMKKVSANQVYDLAKAIKDYSSE